MSIVIIDPVSSGVTYLAAAQELGVDAYVFSADIGERQLKQELRAKAKQVIKIDTNDFDAQMTKIAELGQIRAILPGVEYAVPVASRLGAACGNAHLDFDAVKVTRNKYNFRKNLTQLGLSDISFFQIAANDSKQTFEIPVDFSFPAVVKPVDMAGSIGVRKVENADELEEVLKAAPTSLLHDVGFTTKGDIIVEEYISGQEYSIEGLALKNGNIQIMSITQKILDSEPYFVEIGHIIGQRYSEDLRATVTEYTKAIIQACKLNVGPFHLEIRIMPNGRPIAIELATRLPGDYIVNLLKHASGFDLSLATLCEYLQMEYPTSPEERFKIAAVAFIPRGRHSVFTELDGLNDLLDQPECLSHQVYFQHGERLGTAQDWRSRLGHVIFVGDDEQVVKNLVKRVHSEVKLK